MMNKTKVLNVITGICVICASAGIAYGGSRLYIRSVAEAAADTFIEVHAEEQDKPDIPEDVSEEVSAMKGMAQIARWETSALDAIDETFRFTENDNFDEDQADRYERKLHDEWSSRRSHILSEASDAADSICREYSAADKARDCIQRGYYQNIVEALDLAQVGDGVEAFTCSKDRTGVMDIAVALYRDVMEAGAEKYLQNAVNSEKTYSLEFAVDDVSLFSSRYGVKIPGLSAAEAKVRIYKYESKPDCPTVGMTVSRAGKTKLGSPTRTTTHQQSWAHKKHVYGDMYWEKNGRQIFRASYMDGYIDKVWDTRNSSYVPGQNSYSRKSYSTRKTNSSGSYSRTIDPDDHDIEAYYEDNKDIYDSYEDAEDGFIDDEDAWDDY